MTQLQVCINKAQAYSDSYTSENYTGDAELLKALKSAYQMLNETDKNAFKNYISTHLHSEKNKQYSHVGGVFGAVALPVSDALCFGASTLLRKATVGIAGYLVGHCSGSALAQGLFSSRTEVARIARETQPYWAIQRELKLDLANSVQDNFQKDLYVKIQKDGLQESGLRQRRR